MNNVGLCCCVAGFITACRTEENSTRIGRLRMNNPTPWIRLKRDLLRQIHQGVLESDDEVCVRCGAKDQRLSPTTVRKAFRALVEHSPYAPRQDLHTLDVPSDMRFPATHSDMPPDEGGEPACTGHLLPSPSPRCARASGCGGTTKRAGTSRCLGSCRRLQCISRALSSPGRTGRGWRCHV